MAHPMGTRFSLEWDAVREHAARLQTALAAVETILYAHQRATCPPIEIRTPTTLRNGGTWTWTYPTTAPAEEQA